MSAAPASFVPFGSAHLAALAVVGALALLLARLASGSPRRALAIRLSLAALIASLAGFELARGVREGWLDWRGFLPLELCDAAMVLVLASLVVPRRAPVEIAYFWAGSGSLVAMLTPDLPFTFPRWEFVVFFGLHGLVLVAALVLVFGLSLHPRPGAPRRMLALTAAWTALVGVLDYALDANFMYLRRKPDAPTLLDWMGPWPFYIGAAALLAYLLFELLALPFRREWRASSG